MKKILMILDTRDWAYDDAAQNWKKLLKNEYEIHFLYLEDFNVLRFSHQFANLIKKYQDAALKNVRINPNEMLQPSLYSSNDIKAVGPIFDHSKYDGILFFYHKALCDFRLISTPIPMEKIAICINNEKWVEEGIKFTFDTYLKNAKVLVGCNNFIIDSFKKLNPKIMRASQSIDPKVFYFSRDKVARIVDNPKKFKVGWSGDFSNLIKNFENIRKGCKLAGVTFEYKRDLSRDQLNNWYNSLDLAICASKSEGGPLVLLESGACAIPILTTKVGLSREIIKNKQNGIFINGNAEYIAQAIEDVVKDHKLREHMANNIKNEINKNWTYEARSYEIKSILKELTS